MTIEEPDAVRDCSDSIAEQQAIKYASAVGHGGPVEVIENVKANLKTARPLPIYNDHREIPFVYEILENEEWTTGVLSVIRPWLAVRTVTHRPAAP